ncbi:MAG: trehalose-phosphatase [Alphaproteobacteria bacterium]|nr:trehalose-phosphatase [Alphaproteobacteria bacterium]
MQGMPRIPERSFTLSAHDAVFLDFDGTLAALQDDAETVWLADGMAPVLEACAHRLDGALAIISGRDADDLARRVPQSLWRFGNHGLRVLAPGEHSGGKMEAAPGRLIEALSDIASRHPGVRVEPKGQVLAVHYRAAPSAEAELGIALRQAIQPFAGYSLQHGKMVYEAKPAAANKGDCLLRAISREPFAGRRPVMIGDDTTDEDAFIAAQSAGGIAVKIGDGKTAARHHMATVDDVHALLREFASE